MPPPSPLLPRYGEASLADLTPSLLAALGVADLANVLALPECERACLLVFDGLGWELLRRNAAHAPFLASLLPSARSITAGFPSTTAASVASIGCGLPPGEHGLLGYALTLPGHSRPMNVLRWQVYGTGQGADLREKLHPEKFQARPTAFEAGASAGVEVRLIGPAAHDQSGLSRAALRGGRFQAAVSGGDLAAAALSHLRGPGRALVYAHHNDLDSTGHSRGAGSDAWRIQLSLADRLCERIAERLPAGCTLVVTGDHGMVDLAPHERLDLDDHRELSQGVHLMAGEGRARYLYTQHGAEEDVLGAWREALGDRMWVLRREEAIEAGWFGPHVPEAYAARIGEVIAAAFGAVGIFQRAVDPSQASMVGHHGSLTPEEMLVPLIVLSR
jgi:predicted AlkP superfamily pyrophosphatase or phosphodiesterase